MPGGLDFDFMDGSSQWQPVPEIVRLTFKALHDVVRAQGDQIKTLEKSLQQKVGKGEHASALAEKVNVSELTHTFEELSRVIDAKADAQDVQEALDRKAGRPEVTAALKLKADVSEVQRCLDEKVNVDELQLAMDGVDERSKELDKAWRERISTKVSAEDMEEALATRVPLAILSESVDGSLANLGKELRTEMNEALEKKASKQSVSLALKVKASKEDVDEQVQQLKEQLESMIATKADASAMGSALREKASREDFASQRIEIERLDRLLGERPTQLELQSAVAGVSALLSDTERKFAALEGTSARTCDDIRDAIKHVDRQLTANAMDAHKALALKADVSDLEHRPRTADVESMLEHGLRGLKQRHESDLSRVAHELRVLLDDRISSTKQQVLAIEAHVDTKADRHELEAGLRSRVAVHELEDVLRNYAKAEDIRTHLKQLAQESAQKLMLKCDTAEVHRLFEKMETSLQMSMSSLKVLIGDATATKVEKSHVDKLQAQLDHKANAYDTNELSTKKANVEDVNRTLMEITRELSQRPTLSELNRVVGEQSLIMESLCSEHLLGRWIWKSGRTRGEKHAVPWNVQNINTNPDNFMWTQDSTSITCTAPGLYEVTFGFFTRKKPSVQLLVNGEPVVSAINSASYAVHHSSGRLCAVGPHPAGNVTGLTLIDFVALPPKARISVTYQGEEGGEGFIGLKKL